MIENKILSPLLVILGPTAVGKTDLALRLAQALNGEIVSADSRQIYRYMNIGTAKPTPEQRALVPHHLIDIVDPDQTLSMAEYRLEALQVISSLHQQGKLPMLVGGTGQYITAILEGWTTPPVPPNPTLRAELEAFASTNGETALYNRLLAADPNAATFIHPNNVRRVVRAIEVTETTGQPFSAQRRREPPPFAVQQIGLTMDKTQLYERADRRIDEMMTAGWLDEVRQLRARGYTHHLPAMSGIGYAQLNAYLDGELSLEIALEQTRYATRQFIRNQYTWFRGHDNGIQWHDSETLDADALIEQVGNWLVSAQVQP